jgi:hypothetical protein
MNTAKILHQTEIPHRGPFLQTLRNLISDLAAAWRVFRESRARRRAARLDRRSREIDALYRELNKLVQQPSTRPGLAEEVALKTARLRSLQREEVAEMRERFETSLELSSADSLKTIREARRLLGRDENPASTDSASTHYD